MLVKKLNIPYMMFQLRNGLSRDRASLKNSPWIRSPGLFSLGLILIELAHQEPFKRPRRRDDAKAGYSSIDREFASALRIVATMSGKLGPRYQDVVEKCLAYNFGDLTERRSLEKFHTEIIDVLDELQRGYEKLYMF